MCTTGHLTDFSLLEILQLIEQGKRTGLLMLRILPGTQIMLQPIHYFWVEQGHIVAAASRLDQQGLSRLIIQQGWVSDRVLVKLIQRCCPSHEPLGLSLKNQGVLDNQQLQQLFEYQVLQRVGALRQLKDGLFKFTLNAPLPHREMTGLSLKATKAAVVQEPYSFINRV